MKKKFLSLLLAVSMLLPCVFALNACGKTTTISKSDWENTFDDCSFTFSTDDMFVNVTEDTYFLLGGEQGEHVRLTEGSETKYYEYTPSRALNDVGTLTAITEADFIYGRERFAPILDFIGDNYKEFEYDKNHIGGNTYRAKLQVPAAVKSAIVEFGKVEKDEYLFVVDISTLGGTYYERQGNVVTGVKILDKNYEDYSINDRGFITFGAIDNVFSYYFMQQSLYDIENFNVEFQVIGGSGETYTELYFTKNAVRFYTPDVETSSDYVEGIYSAKDGVYTYYKKDKSGKWSSEPVEEADFTRVYTQYYEMFAGAPLIEQAQIDPRLHRDEITFFSNEPVLGGELGLQKLYYKNYRLKYDDGVVGGKWEIEVRQELGDLTMDYGTFVMTVCDVTIDIPTV